MVANAFPKVDIEGRVDPESEAPLLRSGTSQGGSKALRRNTSGISKYKGRL
jgi:hypothetical protein